MRIEKGSHYTYVACRGTLPECEASIQVESALDPLLDVRLRCVGMLGLICFESLCGEFDGSLPEG